MSDLVGNPDYLFSHEKAQLLLRQESCIAEKSDVRWGGGGVVDNSREDLKWRVLLSQAPMHLK